VLLLSGLTIQDMLCPWLTFKGILLRLALYCVLLLILTFRSLCLFAFIFDGMHRLSIVLTRVLSMLVRAQSYTLSAELNETILEVIVEDNLFIMSQGVLVIEAEAEFVSYFSGREGHLVAINVLYFVSRCFIIFACSL